MLVNVGVEIKMVDYGTSKGVTQDGKDMYRYTRRKFHKAAGNGIPPCERPVKASHPQTDQGRLSIHTFENLILG